MLWITYFQNLYAVSTVLFEFVLVYWHMLHQHGQYYRQPVSVSGFIYRVTGLYESHTISKDWTKKIVTISRVTLFFLFCLTTFLSLELLSWCKRTNFQHFSAGIPNSGNIFFSYSLASEIGFSYAILYFP